MKISCPNCHEEFEIELGVMKTEIIRPPSGHVISPDELERIRSELEKQERWMIEHGDAIRCENCNDVLWPNTDKRCRCGRRKSKRIITDEDLRRYGFD